jgi:hypothetical protein
MQSRGRHSSPAHFFHQKSQSFPVG